MKENLGVIVASFRHAGKIAKNARSKKMPNLMVFTISQFGQVELEEVEGKG